MTEAHAKLIDEIQNHISVVVRGIRQTPGPEDQSDLKIFLDILTDAKKISSRATLLQRCYGIGKSVAEAKALTRYNVCIRLKRDVEVHLRDDAPGDILIAGEKHIAIINCFGDCLLMLRGNYIRDLCPEDYEEMNDDEAS